jgi:hypothetical protein
MLTGGEGEVQPAREVRDDEICGAEETQEPAACGVARGWNQDRAKPPAAKQGQVTGCGADRGAAGAGAGRAAGAGAADAGRAAGAGAPGAEPGAAAAGRGGIFNPLPAFIAPGRVPACGCGGLAVAGFL